MKYHLDKNYIYKFVPFSLNTLKLLIKGEIWLGFPENLNDPFEGEFVIKKNRKIPSNPSLRDFYSKYFGYKSDNLAKVLYDISKDNSIFYSDISLYVRLHYNMTTGVSCFSKGIEDILMWSHYADSHKGLCLIFDKDELIKSINENYPSIRLEEVNYRPNLPTVTIYSKGKDIHFNTDSEVFLNKYIAWKREDELRLFYKMIEENTNRSIPFDKKSLKGIVIGEKMESDDYKTLFYLIDNDINYDIKWGHATKDLEKMKMKILNIEEN